MREDSPKSGTRWLWWASVAVAVLSVVVAGVVAFRMRGAGRTIPAPPDSEIELTLRHEGTTYKLYRGDVYTVGPEPGRLSFAENLYDPDFFTKNYVVVEGVPNKRSPETGTLYPTRRIFDEDFETEEEVVERAPARRREASVSDLNERRAKPVAGVVAELSRITTVHPRTYNEARTVGEQ